jgi:hypothetical protein
MCWSGEASAVLSTIGIAGTVYAAYKKEPVALWMCLGYFTLMEVLQAYTYSVIGQCSVPSNQVATLLGYLHVTFQPFFINAVSLHFIDQRVARKIAPLVYTVCFAAAIMMLIKLYPFAWAGLCEIGRPMCGEMLCSVHGNWHIAWEVPVNTINDNFSWYFLAGFIVPLLYGSWRFTLYHVLAGPLLAYTTTDNMNEWPAVWCLFSIGFMLIVVKTPIRKILYVKAPRWLAPYIEKYCR